MPWPCGRRCIPGLSFEGARFTLIWPNWAVSSMRFWLSWGIHEQKGSPCVESPRGYCMKLWKWSLDCVWSPKMLEVPEFWDIYQEELHGGVSPRDRSVSDAAKLEGQSHVGPLTSDMDHRIWSMACWLSVLLWLSIFSPSPYSSLPNRWCIFWVILCWSM